MIKDSELHGISRTAEVELCKTMSRMHMRNKDCFMVFFSVRCIEGEQQIAVSEQSSCRWLVIRLWDFLLQDTMVKVHRTQGETAEACGEIYQWLLNIQKLPLAEETCELQFFEEYLWEMQHMLVLIFASFS